MAPTSKLTSRALTTKTLILHHLISVDVADHLSHGIA
jgi:hypothetical protein